MKSVRTSSEVADHEAPAPAKQRRVTESSAPSGSHSSEGAPLEAPSAPEPAESDEAAPAASADPAKPGKAKGAAKKAAAKADAKKKAKVTG